jgi:hypothetical protein
MLTGVNIHVNTFPVSLFTHQVKHVLYQRRFAKPA